MLRSWAGCVKAEAPPAAPGVFEGFPVRNANTPAETECFEESHRHVEMDGVFETLLNITLRIPLPNDPRTQLPHRAN